MALARSYLLLKSGVGGTEYQFKVMFEESDIEGRLTLASHQRALNGALISIRSDFDPRTFKGVVLINDEDSAPWGTQANLWSLWEDTDLYAKGHSDSAYWKATIINDFLPKGLEQTHRYIVIPIAIEQREA